MLRKLTSLLFREEEIVIEEEDLEIEPVNIPPIKPIQSSSPQPSTTTQQTVHRPQTQAQPVSKPVMNQEMTQRDVSATPTPQVQARKSFRIDLDNAAQNQPVQSVQETPREVRRDTSKPYVAHEILSPIHGGSQLQNEPLSKPKQTPVKKRTPLTEVISPMYGKVEEPESQGSGPVDLSILELDVESMITPDYDKTSKTDEVQTTLFDYLEGDDSSES
ncbi:hypothetical protein AOC36_05540 [Erysipelothrix larvae]|uniref:Uncharacterized protein n=1 Tax=Erysipelothrix larvae TaxID=1514105 RepID=A0A0X8GZT3_9FIRM|nr:hypothetical protein [Erysipelothrix larvae]AMC93459.1 hypothetical protein AOC36_05540 [Erysipelothrix larvae]